MKFVVSAVPIMWVSVDLFRQVSLDDGCGTGGDSSSETINGDGLKTSHVFSEMEEFVISFIPSYRDVLSQTALRVYDGGELLSKPIERFGKKESCRKEGGRGSRVDKSLLKGVVLGGLEKEFSPLKTRSARKLVKEKDGSKVPSGGVLDGPRVLRDQKSLARVKK